MDVRVGPERRMSTKELLLLNYGVGENSWESLGEHEDQTCQSYGKSTLDIHWNDWRLSWSSNTLATWWKNQLIGKDPGAWKGWGQEEQRETKDEMVGWNYGLNGHEFKQTLGDSEGTWRSSVLQFMGSQSWTWLTDRKTASRILHLVTGTGLCVQAVCLRAPSSQYSALFPDTQPWGMHMGLRCQPKYLPWACM